MRGNALMESAIGLYKTELTGRRGPWRDLAHVEMETTGYLHWFNSRRIHSAIGDVAPAEAEAAWYAARGREEKEEEEEENEKEAACKCGTRPRDGWMMPGPGAPYAVS